MADVNSAAVGGNTNDTPNVNAPRDEVMGEAGAADPPAQPAQNAETDRTGQREKVGDAQPAHAVMGWNLTQAQWVHAAMGRQISEALALAVPEVAKAVADSLHASATTTSASQQEGNRGVHATHLPAVPAAPVTNDVQLLKKLPHPKPWTGSEGKQRDVKVFLRSVARWFELSNVPRSLWGSWAVSFLTDRAEQLWQLEFDDLERAQGASSVTWEQFDAFMLQSYGSLLPAREARDRYDALRQTGTVFDFVREIRQSVRELRGTPLYPDGSVIVDFISKLKPDVRRFVNDNAPVGWWSDAHSVFEKALTFEMNRRIEPAVKPNEPHVLASGSKRPNENVKGKEKPQKRQKHRGVFIPKEEWDARGKAGVCRNCGQSGHIAKNCANEKTQKPFQKQA